MYLAEALSADIPVYVLRSRASRHPDCGQETLHQMAAYFASLMQEVQPRGRRPAQHSRPDKAAGRWEPPALNIKTWPIL